MHDSSSTPSSGSNQPARKASALVLAAGSGTRARPPGVEGATYRAKQFALLDDKPLLAWSLEALANHPSVCTIVLVVPQEMNGPDEARLVDHWRGASIGNTQIIMAAGGSSRRQSALNGLDALSKQPGFDPAAAILVHDGARPFVSSDLVDRLLDALEFVPGAIPTLPITDTVKRVEATILSRGPDRATLGTVQTPQAFVGRTLINAHRAVDLAVRHHAVDEEDFTDDASILEWAGQTCRAVAGDPDNLKITTPVDWERAYAILRIKEAHLVEPTWETRTGLGYDVHRLVPGDGVWLCGHFIAHSHKLDGHSDADVGLHALTDALLGAIGQGDIGTHFPPSDPQWKGAASHIFLEHAAHLVRERGGSIINVDVALVAENPRIGPHRDAMITAMAHSLNIAHSRVSVKATTNERLGFAGREEGIAAFATASIRMPASE